jgi:hypothetical protein
VSDIVSSPPHYTAGGMEAYEVMKAKLTHEEWVGYLKGSALKYILRANFKDEHDTDINKAAWFVDKLKEAVNDNRREDNGTEQVHDVVPEVRTQEAYEPFPIGRGCGEVRPQGRYWAYD